ncbi:amino acid adenylation domain-containing protein [Streptomyces sp. NPDC059851]|uniref:amino acid adenylation domain-containing protein n=1 Tax=Streptomyces sp. NPDC059851 TaxID=3346971 RepID=UPI003664358E
MTLSQEIAAHTVAHVLDRVIAASDPDAVAAGCAGSHMTWRELDEAAWRVTRALRARGIGAGDHVPVLAHRGGLMTAGWLGVLRSGAAYVPLSLDTPRQRLAHVVAEVGAPAALVDEAGRALLQAGAPETALLDLADPGAGTETGDDREIAPLRPEDPAVVIYTSGTTGRPKGVVIPHRGLLNNTLWWASDTELTPADTVLCTWGSAFDGATFDTFRTLLGGARLLYADDTERRDPRALCRLLAGPGGATVASMTPSLLRGVLDVAPDETAPGGSALRSLTTAGEVLTRQLATEAWERWRVPIRNLYGPTENSCIATFAAFRPDHDEEPTIGRPVANTRVYVLGPHQEEIPPGVPGEIYLAGEAVALGYLGQPDRTREAFLPDPYADEPGARMYRTGDRGVLRADGRLDCLGRVDDQVKILGNRIEPQEIRKLIEEHPAVAAAAVTAVGTPPRLVAYVVPDRDAAHDGALPDRDSLLRPLLSWVASAVLPSQVYAVDRLPLTANDKLDFAALSRMQDRPLPHGSAGPAALTGPQREAARLIAQALAEAHTDPAAPAPAPAGLGPDADFFTLGGHSLLAVRMLAAAERSCGRPLALREFLADPTVAGLGRMLQDAAAPRTEPPAGPPAGPRRDIGAETAEPDAARHRATPAQQRLWFIDRVAALRTAYTIPCLLEVRGPVDAAALGEAVASVLGRHPGLRSRFQLDARARTLFYRTDGPAPAVVTVDASAWDADKLDAYLGEQSWAPFDLAADAPARAEIVLRKDRTLLLLTTHHAVSDGRSVQILLDQIGDTYRAGQEGREPSLAPAVHPALTAAAAAAGAAAASAAGDEERAAAYVAALRGAPTDVALPHDRVRPRVQSTGGRVRALDLDRADAARLRTLTTELGCSTFMTAATLLAAVLAHRGGDRDLLIAFPWAGREDARDADAVGMFVNTLVLRADLTGSPTWREALDRVRRAAVLAYRHADVPFDTLAAALHPDRGLDRPPLTPVYLTVEDEPVRPPGLGEGTEVSYLPPEPLRVKYELELTATAAADRVGFRLAYSDAVFDDTTVRQLLDELAAAAAALINDPDADLFASLGANPAHGAHRTQRKQEDQ